MAFANPPLMVRWNRSGLQSLVAIELVCWDFLYSMGDGMLVSSSLSSLSSRPLPNHIDFWLAGWLAKVVEVLISSEK